MNALANLRVDLGVRDDVGRGASIERHKKKPETPCDLYRSNDNRKNDNLGA